MEIRETFEKYSLRLIIVLVLFSIVSTSISVYMYKNYVINPIEKKEYDPLSFLGQVDTLRKSFLVYKSTSSLGLIIRWMTLFDKATYKSGGNPNFNEWDCLSSPFKFWKSFDSNITLEEIPKMRQRLESLNSRIRSVRDVEPGDIVIFKPLRRGGRDIWHLGVVEKAVNHRIFYMDVNANTQTKGLQFTTLYSRQLSGVYKMSLGFWMGDFFRKDVKRK